ncbi:cytochrome P450 3A27-like [Colossoma macropomum]|uniref:cytochrome P450 3A27-like n=1 Tax=Colossoma macropomum TaxID=42526 RepID=UPI001864F662|nr:cytochrome P450 3A27-like [Colossoma macropomum]
MGSQWIQWICSPGTWSLFFLLITLSLLYAYRSKSVLRRLGIPGPKPLPVLGTMFRYTKGSHVLDMECYRKYGRVWGLYDVRQPVVCVMDKDLIKAVMIKECYSLFTNRRDFPVHGELYDALTVVKDDDWKRIRSVLSPSFTSGRLKEMFGIMKMHSSTLLKNLQKIAGQGGTVQVKEVFGPYTMDVVTSTAFSVDIDSLNNPNDPFVTNVKKLSLNVSPLVFFIAALFPFTIPLLEKMNLSLFPPSVTSFFFAVLQRIKAERQDKNYKSRVDFLQLMIDSQRADTGEDGKQTNKGLSDHEILSQAMVFIFAGYETSSSTLSFFFYNLATNPEVLKKLQEEVDRTFPNEGPVQYDALMNMDYLDAALNESMRLYAVFPRTERHCKKTVEICGITIPKGTVVVVPIYVLHRDPEYWPDPDTFIPERFTKENKESIDPYMFMPFGAGPRNCIGMRFALLVMKLAIVETLQRFDVSVCDETQAPLELSESFLLTPTKPITLKFTPRKASHCSNTQNDN